jgi:uncharacterized membrane protein
MTNVNWALTAAYWLHMLATVTWIGSLAALALIVLPAAQRVLDNKAFADLLTEIQKRLEPLGWFCLALLVGTGMFQLSVNQSYQGFLAIHNSWAVAILIKHILFGLMIAVSAYLTWFLLPGLRRTALLQAQGKDSPTLAALQRRNLLLLRLNLVLAVFILALTALARAS